MQRERCKTDQLSRRDRDYPMLTKCRSSARGSPMLCHLRCVQILQRLQDGYRLVWWRKRRANEEKAGRDRVAPRARLQLKPTDGRTLATEVPTAAPEAHEA